MRKILILVLLPTAFASAWWTHVDCQWRYDNGRSGYFGLYRNSQGAYIEMFFGSQYCPVNVN